MMRGIARAAVAPHGGATPVHHPTAAEGPPDSREMAGGVERLKRATWMRGASRLSTAPGISRIPGALRPLAGGYGRAEPSRGRAAP